MSKVSKISLAAQLKKIEKCSYSAVYVDNMSSALKKDCMFIHNIFLKKSYAILGGDFVNCEQVYLFDKSIVDGSIVQYAIYKISNVSSKSSSRYVKVKFAVDLKASENFAIQHFLISNSDLSMNEIEKIDLSRFDQSLINQLNRFEYMRNYQIDNLFLDYLIDQHDHFDDLTFSFLENMIIHESIDKLLNMMI